MLAMSLSRPFVSVLARLRFLLLAMVGAYTVLNLLLLVPAAVLGRRLAQDPTQSAPAIPAPA